MYLSEHETIDHFTVVCLVTWPMNESEAGVDLVLIESSLLGPVDQKPITANTEIIN